MADMGYQRDREEFVVVVVSEGGTVDVARAILRDATTVQRIAVDECNGDYRNGAEAKSEQACARIVKRAATFGARCKFGSDPRGLCVKLLLKSGRYNTWGGASEGYGVPVGRL